MAFLALGYQVNSLSGLVTQSEPTIEDSDWDYAEVLTWAPSSLQLSGTVYSPDVRVRQAESQFLVDDSAPSARSTPTTVNSRKTVRPDGAAF